VRRFAAVTLLVLLAACGTSSRTFLPPVDQPTTTSFVPASTCREGIRPDPACTPGALNPAVTQATIRTTICVVGWTGTIRPPVSYTSALKRQQMIAYGVGGQSPAGFEEDHFIPLETGGAPRDPRNLWPESRSGPQGAGMKDSVENRLHAEVCAGTLTLQQAQQAIVADWTAVR
jgi:hypothetical protein